jgi:hypothetical protein
LFGRKHGVILRFCGKCSCDVLHVWLQI